MCGDLVGQRGFGGAKAADEEEVIERDDAGHGEDRPFPVPRDLAGHQAEQVDDDRTTREEVVQHLIERTLGFAERNLAGLEHQIDDQHDHDRAIGDVIHLGRFREFPEVLTDEQVEETESHREEDRADFPGRQAKKPVGDAFCTFRGFFEHLFRLLSARCAKVLNHLFV